MIREFFELKYRVLETFYDVLYEENYSFGQAAERTFNEFYQEIHSKGIEMIIIYITIGERLFKHNSISEYHLNEIKEAVYLYETTYAKSVLNKYHNEVLYEEVNALKINLKL